MKLLQKRSVAVIVMIAAIVTGIVLDNCASLTLPIRPPQPWWGPIPTCMTMPMC